MLCLQGDGYNLQKETVSYDAIAGKVIGILRDNRLIWFVDIKELIEVGGKKIDWYKMIKHCREVGAERLMLYYLVLAKSFLDVRVGDDILDNFGKKNLSFIEADTETSTGR